ncbi:hypothetical protein JCM8547_006200 [Rhodosporidiobolus lusitaniae]
MSSSSTPSSSRCAPPRRSLVDIRARLLLQQQHTVSISAVSKLVAELNNNWSFTSGASSLDSRIDDFRFSWLLGEYTKVRPLELGDGEEGDEAYSVGGETASTENGTIASSLSFVTASEGNFQPSVSTRRKVAVPSDATAHGILAEKTIKASLSRARLLFEHEDYASLSSVARQAMKKVLRTGHAAYVSPGLVDSVEWSKEFEERGWAGPGIRFGPFKPDLIRFEEMRVKEGEGRKVTWEVVEVKYSREKKDWLYTNYKIQAMFYHLTLLCLLSSIPHLIPSTRLTFWLSFDPLSAKYEERSVSVRTEQAFVEHHLFRLLPEWLQAVKKEEEERLREGLGREVPTTLLKGQPTFLEKLQQSVRFAPPSPSGRTRGQHGTTSRRSSTSPTNPFSIPLLRTPLPHPLKRHTSSPSPPSTPPSPSARLAPSHSKGQSREEDASPPSAEPRFPFFPLPDALPPLPPVNEEEERELQELFARIGFD